MKYEIKTFVEHTFIVDTEALGSSRMEEVETSDIKPPVVRSLDD